MVLSVHCHRIHQRPSSGLRIPDFRFEDSGKQINQIRATGVTASGKYRTIGKDRQVVLAPAEMHITGRTNLFVRGIQNDT